MPAPTRPSVHQRATSSVTSTAKEIGKNVRCIVMQPAANRSSRSCPNAPSRLGARMSKPRASTIRLPNRSGINCETNQGNEVQRASTAATSGSTQSVNPGRRQRITIAINPAVIRPWAAITGQAVSRRWKARMNRP
ncbi:MAG: hypothetical protein NVS3B2_11900 [Ramlibacter sp.]